MDDKNNAEREPRTEVERLLFKNERMQDALLDLKDTMSRMIGEGRLPNDDEVHQWFEGIDRQNSNTRPPTVRCCCSTMGP